MKSTLLLFVLATCSVNIVCEDLYEVLGVGKGASAQEIRKAYKKRAREWHPDKNSDPAAADKFTKINEAYETLSDPKKRNTYDNFGYTAASQNEGRYQNFHRQHFDSFESFFAGGGGGFRFQFGGESSLDKYTITLRNYDTKVLPESHYQPCFIYVHSNFCFECMRMEPIIEKFVSELLDVGLCVGTVHASHSHGVLSRLRISHAPAIVGIVNGRQIHFRGAVALSILREFVRGWFPKNTLQKVNDKNYKDFLNGWADNRVRAIFFGQRTDPSARFLAAAHFYREHVACAYVHAHSEDAVRLKRLSSAHHNRETLVIFNEDMAVPVATISMQQLSRKTLDEILDSNKFLLLPRLSSQKYLDTLCPAEPKLRRRKFCVVLITRKSEDHNNHRASFRDFAQSIRLSSDKVRFVYIYEETQQSFVSALTQGNLTRKNNVLEVAIIWRMDVKRLNYEFLESGWNVDMDGIGESRKQLKERLNKLLTSDNLMPYKAIFSELYNEHSLSLLTRIFYRLFDWSERAVDFFFGYDGMTLLMIILAIVSVVVMGYTMHKVAVAERIKVEKQMAAKKRTARPPSSTRDNQTIHLYDLRYETYNNLVKDADTGLTIVIFVEESSREQLLTRFAQIMQPYSRYSALTFAYLRLEYYVEWYQHLLELSLDFRVKLNNINIQSAVGTILAINGYRKYYYIFHPKKARRWMKQHSNISRAIGFVDDELSSDEENEEKVFNEYLNGLTIWMDRIFDGSAVKIRLDYWPEMSS